MNEIDAQQYQTALRKASDKIKALMQDNAALRRHEPIAVVGMGCRFPGGAVDLDGFWDLLDTGGDAVAEITPDRWNLRDWFDADPEAPGRMYVRHAALLRDVKGFDPGFFNITPKEAESLDPQQRLLLEVSWEAFEDAALDVRRLAGSKAGVFIGLSNYDYIQAHIHSGDPHRISPYSGSGVMFSTAAGRLAYFYDFRGPCITLDTACSSSLVAMDQAIKALRRGDCDLALAGGVSLVLSPDSMVALCKVKALAEDGRSRAFDDAASGYGRGEGCGLLVLKRLADAMRDGDRVHAVLAGSAVNHDGRSNGLTAPNGVAQQAVLRSALADAGLDPDAIDYVEAHGTGTKLGDPIEFEALRQVFGANRSGPDLLIGSVKTNIGHTEAAAGVAGAIKVILALRRQRLPKTLHLTVPNRHIDWVGASIRVVKDPVDWPLRGTPRSAGVSSFGLSGTNAHVIIQEPPEAAAAGPCTGRPVQVLALSAATPSALATLAEAWRQRLLAADDGVLGELCATAASRTVLRERHAISGATTAELIEGLGRSPSTTRRRPPAKGLVFVFSGQGAQYAGMGRGLYQTEPVFRSAFDRCAAALAEQGQFSGSLHDLVMGDQATDAALAATALTQPAIYAIQFALVALWASWGVRPAAVVGHSIGEYAAAAAAGVFDPMEGLLLAADRGRRMQALPEGGAMAAVFASADTVTPVLTEVGGCVIAAINADDLVTVAGDAASVREVLRRLAARSIDCRPLDVSHAFHSPLMQPMAAGFRSACAAVASRPARLPFYSTVSGQALPGGETIGADDWVRQIIQPVRFHPAVEALRRDGYSNFLEIGPGETLAGLIRRGGLVAVSSLRRGVDDQRHIASAVASLWAGGVDLDWARFHGQVARRGEAAPHYPFERQNFWLEVGPLRPARHEADPRTTPSNSAAEKPEETPMDQYFQVTTDLVTSLATVSGFAAADINTAQRLMDMGLDSLMLMKLGQTVERNYGVELRMSQLFEELSTLDDLAVYLERHATRRPNAAGGGQPAVTVSHSAAPAMPSPPAMPIAVAPAMPIPAALPGSAPPFPVVAIRPDAAAPLFQQQLHYLAQLAGQNLQSMTELTRQQLAWAGQRPPVATPQLAGPADTAPTSHAWTSAPTHQAPVHQGPVHQGPPGHAYVHQAPAAQAIADQAAVPPATPPVRPALPAPVPVASIRGFNLAGARLTEPQQAFVENLVKNYVARTGKSKALTQTSRDVLADWKHTLSFWGQLKEAKYPIVSASSNGARFKDLDGNDYIDVALGMGVHFFGHKPGFIHDALRLQMDAGIELGTQSPLTGEAARLLAEMTGNDRVAFSNTGSEVIMVALRLARAATGRRTAVIFKGSYHGIFDGVLATEEDGQIVPIGLGTPPGMIEDLVVLEYDSPASLDYIAQHGSTLAAVLVEPVQSRNPDLQPQGFLKQLRRLTRASGTALIFDEMINGFRILPGGAQAWFGIDADIAVYGKIVGGGMPIGVIAGKSRYLDYIDGGAWAYGDRSGPASAMIYFGGTFCRNPATMATTLAALRHMRVEGPSLQETTTARTVAFCDRLNLWLERNRVPLRAKHFSSQWRLVPLGGKDLQPIELELLYLRMAASGVYTWERRISFFSTAHGQAEIDTVFDVITGCIEEIRTGGFAWSIDAYPAPQFRKLASGEKRLFLLSQREGGQLPYHLPQAFWIDGRLDVDRLDDAFRAVIRRHESLRTGYVMIDGEPWAKWIAEPRFEIERLTGAESDVERIIADFVRPFDLAQAPLMRVAVVSVGTDRHLLLADAHHIVADGLSFNIIAADLIALYEGRDLPQVAYDLRRCLQAADAGAAEERGRVNEAFWRNELAGELPVLELPCDRPVAAERNFTGRTVVRTVPAAMTRQLKVMGRKSGASLYIVLLAAWSAFLHRLTGQADMLVGGAASGRRDRDVAEAVGMFVNTVVFRLHPEIDMTFSQHLAAVGKTSLGVYDHQDYPFEALAGATGGTVPLDTMLSYENASERAFRIDQLVFTRHEVRVPAAMFPIMLEATEENEELTLRFSFAADRFHVDTTERWADQFHKLLAEILHDPDRPLGGLDLLTDPERRLIERFNDTAAPYPAGSSLVDLFEASAARHADRVALRFGAASLTYAEVKQRADLLASALAAKARPGSAIGLFMERSAHVPVALLAILKAGCCYVPVDPAYPAELIDHMLTDSACQAVLTDAASIGLLPKSHRTRALDVAAAAPGHVALALPSPDDVAYVIYTSGSTGQPKGCVVTHRNVVRLVVNDRLDFTFGPDDVFMCVHSFSFDVSVFEVWAAWAHGASVVVASREQARDPAALLDLVRHHRATVLSQTPGAFYGFLDAERRQPAHDLAAHLRMVLFAGDRLEPTYLRPWAASYPPDRLALINLYGITETTVHASYYRLSDADIAGAPGVSVVGRPLPETTIAVLNPLRQKQPVGIPGELWVGGSGVCNGYLNRPALTAERFVEIDGRRLYKSGDLGRLRADGVLEYIGRNDHQVKVRGHRVELAAVQQRLAAYKGVEKALVLDRDGPNGVKELVAYVIGGADLTASSLQRHLAETLPDYAIPSHFVALDALPLTANGKLDRAALPPPEQARLAASGGFVAPRNEVEAKIAAVWCQVLGLDAVSVDDKYFALGGDSIKALQIVSRLHQVGLRVSLAQIFNARTVSALALQAGAHAVGSEGSDAAVSGGAAAAAVRPAPKTDAGGGTPEAHWRAPLAGDLPILDLPLDRPRGPTRGNAGKSVQRIVPAETAVRLQAMGEAPSDSLHSVLLAAWSAFLHRITGQEDMLVAGCERTSLARVTMFRLRPEGEMSFAAHLAAVGAVVREVHDHQGDTSRSLAEREGGAPAPGTLLSLERAEDSTFQIGLVSFQRHLPPAASAFELALEAIEQNAALTLRLGFAADLFEAATIERWADQFLALLTAITDDPDQKLGTYDILTAPERQLIDRFNATQASYPTDKTLVDLFEASAERHGDRVAVRSTAASMTYAELNRRADRLAAALAARARPGSAIGMFLERSEQAAVGLLAILKAGCFYVPVDPSYPAELVEHMLADSACQVVVTELHLVERLPAGSRHLALDVAAAGPVVTLPRPRPDDVAYVIYTSGSTGRPKGCLVTHRNVVRLMVNDRHDFRFGPDDVWLCAHSLSFDFSVWELWGAFAYGGSVVIAERDQMRDPAALLALIRAHRVSVLNQTPAAFYGLIDAEKRQDRHDLAAHLRMVIFGGDRLEPAYLRPWTALYAPDQVALINMYGITETTVHVSYYRLTAADIAGGLGRSLIGRPLPETTIAVLNPQRQPQPVGVPGELWVGGSGVCLGYLNRPDLTRERFVEIGGKRLYRTGDVGRLRADLVLEYIGRNDHQVQIRGHRVEIGSIEQALADHPGIRKALLVDRDGANGAKELVAYIVGDAGLTAAELRRHLARTLPDYMIPSHFVALDALKLTANGKLDRAALPPPEQTRLKSGTLFVAPNTRLEAAIADIWRDVLALPAVGIEDDYFALGGDSMKALRILSRMQHAGMAVTLAQIVSAGTIARLAALMAGGPVEAAAPGVTAAEAAASETMASGATASLTPIQHWLLDTHGKAPNHFNNAALLASPGRIDVAALQRTVTALVAHHDALRLSLDLGAAPSRQLIAGSADLKVEIVGVDDATALTEHAGSVQRGFDVARVPLLRVVLYRLPSVDRLLIVCHHLTVDGVSWRILLEDLGAGYAAAIAGRDPARALPAQSRPWRDWAGTLADAATSRELLAEIPYWASVEAASVPAVPTDFDDPDNRVADHRTVGFELDWRPSPGTRRPVPDINMTLLAAMATALRACFGMDRLRIRLEGHGREEIAPGVDVSRTIGWFTTVFPLLVDLSGAATVSDAVARVSDALARVPRKGIGYGILRYLTPGSLRPGLVFGKPPEIGFNYLGEFATESGGGFRLADEPTGTLLGETMRRPELIDVETAIVGGRLTVAIGYGERLHKRATIERLAAAMEAAVRTLMGDGGGSGGAVPQAVPASDSTAVAAVSRHLGVREDAIEAVLPLTSLQAGMLFHSLIGGTEAYFVQFTYHLAGKLDLALFEASWQRLAQRHQALRTAIVMPPSGGPGEAPRQVVLKQRPVPVHVEDLTHLPQAEQTQAVARIAAADRGRGFDLARDALVRVTIVRLGPEDVDVIWSSHHAILDGWSIGILQEEFAAIYAAMIEGSDAGLAPPPPFARHLDWLAARDMAAARRFWAEILVDCPSARMLPGARPDGPTAPYALEEHAFLLDAATTRRLGALASRLEVTLNTLVQTLWGVLLGAALDTDDVVFGTVVSGRPGELDGIERMVGLFLQTIPVRISFSPADSFADVARRVQASAIESETFNHLPLAEIQAQQGPRHTLFDHLLAFENYPIDPKARVGGLQVSDVRGFEQGHYDYSVVVHPGERLDIKFSFNRNVLPREVFIRLEARLRDLIAAVLANPWQRFDDDAPAMVRPPSGGVPDLAQAEDYPVSHAQRRLWVLAQMGGNPAAYTLPAAFRLDGKLERTVLISALEALPSRHEALRTVFTVVDDEPRQVVLSEAGFRVDCIDLSRLPDPIAAAHEQAENHRQLRFDLATFPLIAARLLILGPDTHVLLVNVHHIVADAWSVTVMVDEILHLARGLTLPPLHSQYKDHAMRERDNLLSGKADADRDWWHGQMAQLPERLDLPFDRPVPEMPSFNGDRVSVTLDEGAVAALRNLAHAVRGTLFTGLLALVAELLRRHTGHAEMILGIPVTARDGVEQEQQVGFYVNTLPLRVSVGSGDSAGTLSARIMDAMLAALEHRAYPFDLLVDDLALPRDGGRPPLFDVMAVFQEAGRRDLALDDVAVTPFGAAPKVAKFPLTFIFCETATGATLDLEYATDLFDRERIERMAGHFVRLLEGAVRDGKTPLCTLDCFGDAERRLLAGQGQAIELAADATAVSLFAEQVAASPDRAAVIHRSTTLSYAELDARANDLAWALRMDNEVARGDVVAVLLDRSDHLAVAFLGILKAGAVYLPVDPTYPADRIAFMLADSGARAIVTEPRHAKGLSGAPPEASLSRRVVDIAALCPAAGELPDAPEPSDIAYLIYTSGSTGVPKGVILAHRGAVNLALAQRHGLGIQAQHRVLQFAPSSFDASVWEMIMALLNGACLVIADAETVRDPVEFADYVGRHAVTVATLPPVYLNELDDSAVASLQLLITAGEAPNPDRARRLARTLTYVNAYGPTETTVCATWHKVDPEADGPIPIGRAIANTEVIVLDGGRRLCPIGVRGEIYIGGPGLARLYLGRPELTEAAFVAHPLRPGERLYRTGDQGIVREDGAIHYAGRNDRQVKLRGHRIELAEVERIIARHPGVRDAVVSLCRPGASRPGGQSQLVGYIVPVSEKPGGELTPQRLQEDLARTMPAHMMPARFVVLDALPLLPNGKIDHSALPDPSDAVVTSLRIDDPLEAFVAAAWQDVLHHVDFGRNDRFFEVGGDSIKAIQVISRLRREGHRIEMREFMAASSVAALASLLAERTRQAKPQSGRPTASLGAEELEGLFNDD